MHKNKSKFALILGALAASCGVASATPIDISTSVTEMIGQVTATAGDALPFVVALVGGGLVFKLIKKWIK